MTTKNCTACKTDKLLSEFSKFKISNDGLRYNCKTCEKELISAYRKTKKGIISRIYGGQFTRSRKRGHDDPDYTKDDFTIWLLSSHEFQTLYDDWVDSGYLIDKKPSCDRLDDYKPYTFDNIQVVTWRQNREKAYSDRKNGINNKANTAVSQLSVDGKYVSEYHSISQASRETGINHSGISRCLTGARRLAGGFVWKYA